MQRGDGRSFEEEVTVPILPMIPAPIPFVSGCKREPVVNAAAPG